MLTFLFSTVPYFIKTFYTFETVPNGMLSKSTRVQNQPDFFSISISLFHKLFAFIFLVLHLFFTITVTPNSYSRSVSSPQIRRGWF